MRNIKTFDALAILSAAAVFLAPALHAGSSGAATNDVAKRTPSNKGDDRDSLVNPQKKPRTPTVLAPDKDQASSDADVSTAKKAGSGTKVNPSNSTGKKEIKTQNTDAQKKSSRTEAQRIITVDVKGLSCPFCVLGIEKRLKAISSVATISSNWGKGEMYVKLKAGQSVSDDDLRPAIKRAGFTPGKIDRSGAAERKDSR